MQGAARLAVPADLPRLAALYELAAEELQPMRGGSVFLAREARSAELDLADAGRVVVAGTIDEAVVGYGTGRIEVLREGTRLGVVDDLYVESEARGVGVGEAVMEALLGWFRDHRCDGVDALALPGNRATKNFFEESGFTARLLVMHRRLTGE